MDYPIYGLYIIAILIVIYIFTRTIENLDFYDELSLNIPNNPVALNNIQMRNRGRIITIDKYYKLDKYNNIENISYSKPKPEMGENGCYRVKCPKYLDRTICIKCT